MSLTGAIAILAVLLIRLLLKKAPKRWSWLLWAVVLFRLLTPFGIPMEVSLPFEDRPKFQLQETSQSAWNSAEPSYVSEPSEGTVSHAAPAVGAGGSASEVYAPDPAAARPSASEGGENSSSVLAESAEGKGRAGFWDRVLLAAPFVWLAGAAAMIVWNLVSCALLKRKLREAVPAGGNLYETDRANTAFVFGLFSPRVYLPAGLGPVEKACVAEHERAHIRRLDPLWRLLSFAALSLHWFNPLVWLAFRLSGKDMEMSCDEAVLNRAPIDIRAAYSKTLVRFASHGRSAGPVLAFGEGETGSRVKNIMRYKKPVLWVSIAAGIVLVLSAVVLAVNPTARDTSLPYSRYRVDDVPFYHDERTPDMVKQLRFMIAGDGSLGVRFADSDTIGWENNGSVEPLETEGLTEFVKEQTGVKTGRITDAAIEAREGDTSGWLFFSTSSGGVWLASVSMESGEARSVHWLARLKNEYPGEEPTPLDVEYCLYSLYGPVGRQIKHVEFLETGRSPYVVAAFTAGLTTEEMKELIMTPDYDEARTAKRPGLAVFEAKENSVRLLTWALVEDAVFEGDGRVLWAVEGQPDGSCLLTLPDGRTLTAEVSFPEKKKTLFGKTEYVGECSIRFSGGTGEADETPDTPDALPYTRYAVDEVMYFFKDPDPEATAQIADYRFEIAGDGSFWINDFAEAWYGRSDKPEAVGTENLSKWLLEQTGADIPRIRDALLYPVKDAASGWILFSTEDGEFYAASIGEGVSFESGECRILCRLKIDPVNRDETSAGAKLDFLGHSLRAPVGRDIFPIQFSEDNGTPFTVFAFFAGLTEEESRELGYYDADQISYTFGVAVFRTEGRSVRLVDWALEKTATFLGLHPLGNLLSGGVIGPRGGGFSVELPDGRILRVHVDFPEIKKSSFGLKEVEEGDLAIVLSVGGPQKPADPASPSQPGESAEMTAEKPEEMHERQEAERQEAQLRTREQIDAAYDAFLAEHYELEDMSSYLAAYATRRIDLNRDGYNELVVYRMPTENSYPLDIYEYSRNYGTVRAFHTTLEGIPASLNADPSGFWCAQIGAHDPDLADGFYGDFFTFGSETYLISMDGSEWWKKVECHAFTTVSGSLAAQTVFSAERCGPYYFDEAKRSRSFVNGQEIPFDGYFDALKDWRKTWIERTGGDGEALTQTPLWDESELSGWPIVWVPPENGIRQTWSTPGGQPLFTLTFPEEWEENVTAKTGEWGVDPKLRIDFYDRPEQEKNGLGLLASLVLHPHDADRFYPTAHKELATLTTPDGESYDLVLVHPGDMQYWSFRDHYTYWLIRLRSVAARAEFPQEIRVTIQPEGADGAADSGSAASSHG